MQDVGWTRIPISKVEDLHDAVRGAGLDAMQLSRAPLRGSLAFSHRKNVTYNSGYIDGRVAIKGPLSENMVTLGLGVYLPSGNKQWFCDVGTGNIGVFLQGDCHEALYTPGSIYATATLTMERLEEIAANLDLVLTKRELIGSGVVSQMLAGRELQMLQGSFRRLHSNIPTCQTSNLIEVGDRLLNSVVQQLARQPINFTGSPNPQGYARIVSKAREFILHNLETPLAIETITAAAMTSERTLHRAFMAVLGETPYSYVQKARLHRLRREIISDAERACTITVAAYRWGFTEPGRVAGHYYELFGELPSTTMKEQKPVSYKDE